MVLRDTDSLVPPKGLATASWIPTTRFKRLIPIVFKGTAKVHIASGAFSDIHESQTLTTAAEHVLA